MNGMMQVDRAAKSELVTALHDVFKDTGVIVVAHYAGMTVAQMTDYRRRIKEAGGKVKVAKNRLAKLALKDTDAAAIADLFKGQTCIAYSKDPIAAAQDCRQVLQGERQARDPRRCHGQDGPRCRRRQSAWPTCRRWTS